jgi:hypothetical protein
MSVAGEVLRRQKPQPERDCFASLAMTANGVVIARSAATKQSRAGSVAVVGVAGEDLLGAVELFE